MKHSALHVFKQMCTDNGFEYIRLEDDGTLWVSSTKDISNLYATHYVSPINVSAWKDLLAGCKNFPSVGETVRVSSLYN